MHWQADKQACRRSQLVGGGKTTVPRGHHATCRQAGGPGAAWWVPAAMQHLSLALLYSDGNRNGSLMRAAYLLLPGGNALAARPAAPQPQCPARPWRWRPACRPLRAPPPTCP